MAAFPKVDLHVHLDGSVRPEMLLALARERKLALPADTPEALLAYMTVPDDCESLRDYLKTFDFVLPFMQDGEALERIACDLVRQAAEERCLYMEVRFAPQLHTAGGMTPDAAIAHVLSGLRQGEAEFGVASRAIAICMRHHDADVNRPVVEAAARFRDRGVVAVDLAGDEASFPASRFRGLFGLAAGLGLPVTIHAGEAAGPDNVREAVERLGARRIGHGVRLTQDRSVLELVKARRIPLEMCPVSNLQTKAVELWRDYPLPDFLREGLAVTVNTDNRTVSGTTLTREYLTLMERCGLAEHDIAGLVRGALDAAFAGEDVKTPLRRKMNEAFVELGL